MSAEYFGKGNSLTPIIMLTSYSDQVDKIVGLEIGADDYITKPFDNREVLARIRAQLRKSQRIEDKVEKEATISIRENYFQLCSLISRTTQKL